MKYAYRATMLVFGLAIFVWTVNGLSAQEPAPKDRPRDPAKQPDVRDSGQPPPGAPADRGQRNPDRRDEPGNRRPPGDFSPPGPNPGRGNNRGESPPGIPFGPNSPRNDRGGGGRPDDTGFGPGFGPPMNRPPMDGRNYPGGPNLEDMKKYDPEMYELERTDGDLERESYDLSQQYRRSPRDQRDALKKQLQEVVQKQFDVRQSRRQLQLKRLEEELTRMRSALDRRTELRQQIVDRHLAELVGEQNDLDF